MSITFTLSSTLEKSKESKTYSYYFSSQIKGRHNEFGVNLQPDLAIFEKYIKYMVESRNKVFEQMLQTYMGSNALQHHQLYQFEI